MVRSVAFIGTLLLAMYLAPKDFGILSIGLSVMIVGRFLSDAGLGAALVRQPEVPDRRQLAWLQGFQLAMTTGFVGVLTVFVSPLGVGGEVATIMAAALLIETFRIPGALMAQRRLRWSPLIRAEIADTLVFYTWAVTAAAMGVGIVGIAFGAIARSVVNTVIVVALTKVIVRPRFSIRGIRSLLGFGAAFQAVPLLTLVRDQGIILLAGAIVGAAALGLWSLTYRLLMPVWQLFQAAWRVSFPAMARLIATGDDPGPLMRRALGIMTVTTGAVLVPLVAATPILVPAWFGSEWSGVIWMVPPTALGMMIVGPISTCIAGYLYAVGRPGVMVRSLGLDAAAWFAVSLPLLPIVGIEAVAWGLLAGFTVEAVVLYRSCRREIDLDLRHSLLLPMAVVLAATTAGWVLAESLPPGSLSLLLAAGGAEVLYLGTCIVVARDLLRDLIGVLRRALARARPSAQRVTVAQV